MKCYRSGDESLKLIQFGIKNGDIRYQAFQNTIKN
jgi:hypothetical protein